VTGVAAGFRERYRAAFASYLVDPGETSLRDAYELGRSAVRERLSVLDLAAVHHDALAEAHEKTGDHARTATLAGEFFVESLSAYELVQRGLREAQEQALIERRHTAILRQLSSFLADTSLAVDAAASIEEVLQLVADHARELTGAAWCTAVAEASGLRGKAIEVYAGSVGLDTVRARELGALYSALDPPSGAVRMTGAELAGDPLRAALHGGDPPALAVRNWLAASLRSLDGRPIGLIQVLDKTSTGFSELDEAMLVQLAQMVSASVERALAYRARAETLDGG
jgi:hypothetical protein